MLVEERRDIIKAKLDINKVIKVADLCNTFKVSAETIRRDLEYLEEEGYLKRVYGGAVSVKKTSAEPLYNDRSSINKKEKIAIGKETANLVKDGETLIIDLGTTTLEVARYLKDKKNLTIITNCLNIALELIDIPGNRIFLAGGELRKGELSLSGSFTKDFFRQFNVDKTIIGVGGITLDAGISDYHIYETKIRKIMIDKGEEVIAVADHSKFGVKALMNVCNIEDIDTLVTDKESNEKDLEIYRDIGIDVIEADVSR